MKLDPRSSISRKASWRAAVCSLLLLLFGWWLWTLLPGDTGVNPLVADAGSGGVEQLEKGAAGRDGGLGGTGDSTEPGTSPSGDTEGGEGAAPAADGSVGGEPDAAEPGQSAEGSGGDGGGSGSESSEPDSGPESQETAPESEPQLPGAQPAEAPPGETPPEPATDPATAPQKDTAEPKPNADFGAAPQAGTLASSDLSSMVKSRDFRQPGRPYQGGNFFEVKGSARRIVYVVDFSSSMSGGKFSRTRTELVEALKALPADRQFFVVFFNQNAEPMPGNRSLRPANRANIDDAVRWIDQVSTSGGTDPSDALDIALRLNPEVVMVLSDGGFSSSVVDDLRRKNGPSGKVSISTIGFYDDAITLRQIAAENRGDYRYIPRPRSGGF